jgi:MFS family permease
MQLPAISTLGAAPQLGSLQALDSLNLFLSALLAGFGPRVVVYLTDLGWGPADIGLVLTMTGLSGLLTQVAAGELIDTVRSKRSLLGIAAVAVALALLMLGLHPDFGSVAVAAVLLGAAGSVLGPVTSAISLGLVGHAALSERLGRNQQFASIGGLAGAGAIGAIAYVLSTRDSFLVAAAMSVPVLAALIRIRAADIHFCQACGAPNTDPINPKRVSRSILLKDHGLLIFAACLFLFQLANASLLPLVGEGFAHAEGRWSSLLITALVVAPQAVVALLASWVGMTANRWGRRPLLLIGLGILPIRAGLLAVISDPGLLILIQLLDGLTGATLGVLTAVVIADLTNGTGRFNLAQGLVGTLSALGAALSTSISGIVVERFGHHAGFATMALVSLLAVAILWLFMPETKPSAAAPEPAPRLI